MTSISVEWYDMNSEEEKYRRGDVGRANFLPRDGNTSSDQFAGARAHPFKINRLFSLRNETQYVLFVLHFCQRITFVISLLIERHAHDYKHCVLYLYIRESISHIPRPLSSYWNLILIYRSVIIRFATGASLTKLTDLVDLRSPLRSPWPAPIRARARAHM